MEAAGKTRWLDVRDRTDRGGEQIATRKELEGYFREGYLVCGRGELNRAKLLGLGGLC